MARLRAEELGADLERWCCFLAQLRKQGSLEGFLSALAACAEDMLYGARVPTLIRQEIRTLVNDAEYANKVYEGDSVKPRDSRAFRISSASMKY